jgi:hypothetical protein
MKLKLIAVLICVLMSACSTRSNVSYTMGGLPAKNAADAELVAVTLANAMFSRPDPKRWDTPPRFLNLAASTPTGTAGTAKIRVTFNEAGSVEQVQMLTAPDPAQVASINKSVWTWKIAPPIKDGRAMKYTIDNEITFNP